MWQAQVVKTVPFVARNQHAGFWGRFGGRFENRNATQSDSCCEARTVCIKQSFRPEIDGRMAAQTGTMMSSGSFCTSGRQQNVVQALFGRSAQGQVSYESAPWSNSAHDSYATSSDCNTFFITGTKMRYDHVVQDTVHSNPGQRRPTRQA